MNSETFYPGDRVSALGYEGAGVIVRASVVDASGVVRQVVEIDAPDGPNIKWLCADALTLLPPLRPSALAEALNAACDELEEVVSEQYARCAYQDRTRERIAEWRALAKGSAE